MNNKTTIAGLVTATIMIAFWIASTFFKVVVPPEVPTFLIGLAISVIALFADPESFREAGPKIITIITVVIAIVNFALKTFWNIILPDTIIAFIQAILIFALSYIIKDAPATNPLASK